MPMLRSSERTHKKLKRIADETGMPMNYVLEIAVESYARTLFLEGLNADYAALQSDGDAWSDELAERALWEATLGDGLKAE